MTDEKPKFDPFKPAQPRIPGVSDAPPAPPPETVAPPAPAPRRKLTPQQIAIGAAGAVILGIVLAWLFLRPSTPSAPAIADVASAPMAPAPVEPAAVKASSSTVTPEVVPIYPDEVATAEEMDRPWAFKRFNFIKKVTQGPVPALLVRLPGGSARSAASYWAFALKPRYGK
ncbi:MAG: hypothetical protein M1451_12370, partial [Acidobacteria bacterium]|nr:hypothetical protein [Acidobacteriota bacterium]